MTPALHVADYLSLVRRQRFGEALVDAQLPPDGFCGRPVVARDHGYLANTSVVQGRYNSLTLPAYAVSVRNDAFQLAVDGNQQCGGARTPEVLGVSGVSVYPDPLLVEEAKAADVNAIAVHSRLNAETDLELTVRALGYFYAFFNCLPNQSLGDRVFQAGLGRCR